MAASRSRRPVCGLIIKQDQKPIPLKDVSIEAEINGYVLGLKSVLQYTNESSDPVEVLFRFPLEESSAVVGLTAVIDGRKIKAEIREKEEARAAYDDAIASGQSAALAEEKTGDIFSISLGNLPPKKDAEIHLELVSELSIDAEENVRFSLPSVLKPRYTPAGSTDPLAGVSDSVMDTQVQTTHIAGFSGFQLSILSSENIAEVTSPTHSLERADSGDKVRISLTDQKPADKDLVILIKHKHTHQPSAVVEQGQEKASDFMKRKVVMVNFFPEFGKNEADCEFIFLVDRSGSMTGDFIKSARETLILFMKSLPENCRFNIIGFGSRYEQLFPEVSVPYSQSTVDTAVAHLTDLQANLGGTELLTPLNVIFRTKPETGFSRQLFVLTDGAVSNTNVCIDKVKQHESNSRCFTFGIGSGASTALVEGLARAGNGSAEFVKEGERLQPKVIRSLKRALQPAVTDVSLEFKVDGKAEVLQSPQTLPPIFSGEKLVAYGFVKTKSDQISGKATLKGKLLGSMISHSLPFSSQPSSEASSVQTIHHLAAKALIKDWERERKAKGDIVKLSIETSVISMHTAFIAIDEENSKPIKGALQTWDVQTRYPMANVSYGMAMPVMASARGGGGGGMFKMKKRSKGMAASAPPPPMAASGPPPPPGVASGPPPPPMSSKHRSFSPMIKKSAPPPKRSMDVDLEIESGLAAPIGKKGTRSEVTLSIVITAQQADGSWKMNQDLARFLGKSLQDVEAACPGDCKGVLATFWATLLILELLQTKYVDDQDEWELIGMKAESWTKKQSLPSGVTMGELQTAAKSFLA